MSQDSSNNLSRSIDIIVRPMIFAPLLGCLGLVVSAGFVNHGLPMGDEGALLTLASRIMRGQVFYRHIDASYFPGAAYLLALWMSIFGEHVNSARWLAGGIFSGTLLGLYWTAIQLLDRRRAAIFGSALLSLKFLAWPGFTAYSHSDLSLCFASLAVALLVGHSYRGASIRLVVAGALVALAIASKQNLGIYLMLTATLLLVLFPAMRGRWKLGVRQRLSEVGAFAFGLLLIAGPMLGYFAHEGLLRKLVVGGLLRPLREVVPASGISFLEPLAWWNLGDWTERAGSLYSVVPYSSMLTNGWLPGESWYPAYWIMGELFVRALYTSVIVVLLVALWRWVRAFRNRRLSASEEKILVFSLLAFAIFFSAFPRADYLHVMGVYPVVLLLLFGLRDPGEGDVTVRESHRRTPWRSACAVAVLLLVTGVSTAMRNHRQVYHLQIERADLYLDPANSWVESLLNYVEESLSPFDRFFVYGHEAHFYFLTKRPYYPWSFVQLYPGQVGGDVGLYRVLRRQPPKLILRGAPGISSYAGTVDAFIDRNFEVVDEEMFETHPPPMGERPDRPSMQILRSTAIGWSPPEAAK